MTLDRERLYSLTDAAKLLPSCHGGKTVHPETLRKWVRAGRVKAVQTGRHGVFIPGSEIARLLCLDEWPEWQGRTKAEARAASERAMEELRKRGMRV